MKSLGWVTNRMFSVSPQKRHVLHVTLFCSPRASWGSCITSPAMVNTTLVQWPAWSPRRTPGPQGSLGIWVHCQEKPLSRVQEARIPWCLRPLQVPAQQSAPHSSSLPGGSLQSQGWLAGPPRLPPAGPSVASGRGWGRAGETTQVFLPYQHDQMTRPPTNTHTRRHRSRHKTVR